MHSHQAPSPTLPPPFKRTSTRSSRPSPANVDVLASPARAASPAASASSADTATNWVMDVGSRVGLPAAILARAALPLAFFFSAGDSAGAGVAGGRARSARRGGGLVGCGGAAAAATGRDV